MRSGLIDLNSGYLHYANSHGFYWSSISGNASNTYDFYFGSSTTYPTYLSGRYYGFPARCLAFGAKLLKFVRSGRANLGYGYMRNVGVDGHYWSSTSYNATSMHHFFFNATNIYTTSLVYRYIGFSTRCLAFGELVPSSCAAVAFT